MSRDIFKNVMKTKVIVESSKLPSIASDSISGQLEPILKSDSAPYLLGVLFLLNEGDATASKWPQVTFSLSFTSTAGTNSKVAKRADFAAVATFKEKSDLAPPNNVLVPALSELILAAHATDLKQSQIKTWAQSHGIPTDSAEVLKTWLPTITRHVKPDHVADLAEVTTWLKYRLTSQSTSTLCKIAVEGLGTAAQHVFVDSEIDAINDSSAFDLDSGIPQAAIAKAYVYLDTIGYNFGSWYQGRKAVAVWSVAEAIKLRTVIAESIKKKVSKELIDLAKTSEDVIALAGITFSAARARDVIEKQRAEQEAWEAAVKYLAKRGQVTAAVPEGVTPDLVAQAIERIAAFEQKVSMALVSA